MGGSTMRIRNQRSGGRKRRQVLSASREEDPLGDTREDGDGSSNALDGNPAVARHKLPRRTHEEQMR